LDAAGIIDRDHDFYSPSEIIGNFHSRFQQGKERAAASSLPALFSISANLLALTGKEAPCGAVDGAVKNGSPQMPVLTGMPFMSDEEEKPQRDKDRKRQRGIRVLFVTAFSLFVPKYELSGSFNSKFIGEIVINILCS